MGIQALLSDPAGYLRNVLLLLPAILPALILHECAHGWVAYRLGDPTAKMLGRLSLDPRKHLDPLGTACLVFLGLGWAKPVPINPRNFRKPRRDDFLVSIAGVTTNFILFLIGYLVWHLIYIYGDYSFFEYNSIPNILMEILVNFFSINLSLAIFNLIPIPPLDGYHVMNDLILRRPLFATQQSAMIGRVIMLALLWTGYLGRGLSYAANWVAGGVSEFYMWVFRMIGIV